MSRKSLLPLSTDTKLTQENVPIFFATKLRRASICLKALIKKSAVKLSFDWVVDYEWNDLPTELRFSWWEKTGIVST